MFLGLLSADEIARIVTKRPPKPHARARYFRSDDLLLNGYCLVSARSDRVPEHISIYFGAPVGLNELEQARAAWSQAGRVTLEELTISADEARQ
jgi:hypothetical protein